LFDGATDGRGPLFFWHQDNSKNRKRDDKFTVHKPHCARTDNQAAICFTREVRDTALDLRRVADVDRADLHAERWCYRLDDGKLSDPSGYGGVAKDRNSRHAWSDLLKDLLLFHTRCWLSHDHVPLVQEPFTVRVPKTRYAEPSKIKRPPI